MLFPEGVLKFNPAWQPAKPVRMGEAMGDKAACICQSF
jgi:phosphatidylserine decarboxylase